MSRRTWTLLVAAVAVTVLVAYQAGTTMWRHRSEAFGAQTDLPTVAPGVDVLAGVIVSRLE